MNGKSTNFVADPGAVGALCDAIARGNLDLRTLLDGALGRIDQAEPIVQGWRIVDLEGARAQAERLAVTPARGPLHGIPVAVKDVIDVAGWPTRAGSRSRNNSAPCTTDAQVVTRLREAGAIILGKAHTTEFAFFDGPPPTRNPYDMSRTPGGSSSGPAAVVAAGMVPVSLGTQTAGSVSRPAAYCGIAAFKPSSLSWSSFGVVPFAPSFDTVGVFGYRVADAAYAARALMPSFLPPARPHAEKLRIGVVIDPMLETASVAVCELTQSVAAKLRAGGVAIEKVASHVEFSQLNDVHLTMREYELGHVHTALLDTPDGTVTPSLREAVRRGYAIDIARYLEALATLTAARSRFWMQMSQFDALIVPAAPDIAPIGMATGDARFIIPLTALAGPIVSIPVDFDQAMPLGIMLTAAPGTDRTLLDIAERLAPMIETPR